MLALVDADSFQYLDKLSDALVDADSVVLCCSDTDSEALSLADFTESLCDSDSDLTELLWLSSSEVKLVTPLSLLLCDTDVDVEAELLADSTTDSLSLVEVDAESLADSTSELTSDLDVSKLFETDSLVDANSDVDSECSETWLSTSLERSSTGVEVLSDTDWLAESD